MQLGLPVTPQKKSSPLTYSEKDILAFARYLHNTDWQHCIVSQLPYPNKRTASLNSICPEVI
jgi:hypothetical protein